MTLRSRPPCSAQLALRTSFGRASARSGIRWGIQSVGRLVQTQGGYGPGSCRPIRRPEPGPEPTVSLCTSSRPLLRSTNLIRLWPVRRSPPPRSPSFGRRCQTPGSGSVECIIAGRMAEAVVAALEIIQIEHNDRKGEQLQSDGNHHRGREVCGSAAPAMISATREMKIALGAPCDPGRGPVARGRSKLNPMPPDLQAMGLESDFVHWLRSLHRTPKFCE